MCEVEHSKRKAGEAMSKNIRGLTLEKAKEQIAELQRFIKLVESYNPDSFETTVIYEYAIQGSVARVASKLNEQGQRINGRKLTSNDISAIIVQKPFDELHEIIRRVFQTNSPYK
jgi:hypothetical protein